MATPFKIYDAKGGPDRSFKDPDGRHAGGRTHAGKYVLHHKGQHVSTSWPMSTIKWGTPIKPDLANKDVLYEEHGKWLSVRKKLMTVSKAVVPSMDILTAVMQVYEQMSGKLELPATWVFNDFGHATWYMFKDKDGDGKLTRKAGEKIHNEFIHTTPPTEYQYAHRLPVVLETSHGCIHVKPSDIDEMSRKGYMKGGTVFVVHKYEDKPVITLKPMPAKAHRFSLHFFPGLNQIVVYAH